jgi:hypothetical protein
MITTRVLASVLLGVNEQVNCSNCVSAFGSAGSFSAGVHGRYNITDSLSILGGIAYAQFNENGFNVTSAPRCAMILPNGASRGRSSMSAPCCLPTSMSVITDPTFPASDRRRS